MDVVARFPMAVEMAMDVHVMEGLDSALVQARGLNSKEPTFMVSYTKSTRKEAASWVYDRNSSEKLKTVSKVGQIYS